MTSSKRRLAVLTTGRQDIGVLRSTLFLLRDHPAIELRLWAGGMHLEPRFCRTIDRVVADGLTVPREVPFLEELSPLYDDTGRALAAVGAALADESPWALMLLGDRTETLAAGVAATLARVPIVHVHGGEETEGAIDNACRHALTKLSHLHLVSHATHAARVLQMGEQPETIRVVGAPGLDNQYRHDLPDRDAMTQQLGIPLEAPLALVTIHPTTLGDDPMAEVEAVAGAIERVAPAACVITQPNADEGGESIRGFWRTWCAGRPRVALVDALGETAYWALLQQADVVLGNSSSGIVEAAPIGVPVVNVGDRQRGRLRFGRVWDVPPDARLVEQALREAVAAGRRSLGGESYPSGPAAPRIVAALEGWVPPVPLRKQFRDDVVDKRGATRG